METSVDLKPCPDYAPDPVQASSWLSEAVDALLLSGGFLTLTSGLAILAIYVPAVLR